MFLKWYLNSSVLYLLNNDNYIIGTCYDCDISYSDFKVYNKHVSIFKFLKDKLVSLKNFENKYKNTVESLILSSLNSYPTTITEYSDIVNYYLSLLNTKPMNIYDVELCAMFLSANSFRFGDKLEKCTDHIKL